MLGLATAPLGVFRGALEAGHYRWLGWDGERAVGYIDAGTFDRWTTWEGGPGGGRVIDQIPGPAAAITYVVDPRLRGRGYAAAMIRSLLGHPEFADVVVFGAGVEPDNKASVGCLRAAGFAARDPVPDWEGIVYYMYMRGPGAAPGGSAETGWRDRASI
jgi:RimJ/RimL family protein N-acetyltransferase